MRLGFDMDGVLRKIDLARLWLAINTNIKDHPDKEWVEGFWNLNDIREPLLNPSLFALPEDEIYVITNCLSEASREWKEMWIKHFYGDRIKLITISVATDKWGKEYVDPVAEAKLQIILAYRIELYIDDDPAIVRRMRKLIEERNVLEEYGYKPVILKYGAWIREWY